MTFIDKLKGVIQRMIRPKSIENVLHISPTISSAMKTEIELWELMYKDKAPWLTENVRSAGIPSLIASEKARTATIEMDIKITGESEKAKFIRDNFKKVIANLREQLEYGVALGGFVIKPYVTIGPNDKYIMNFNYTKATNFYPLSFSAEGDVTEAAFIDRIITKTVIYSKVEYHKLEGTRLTVKNMAFKSNNTQVSADLDNELGEPIALTTVSQWASLAPEVIIDNVDSLLFAYFKMPEANTIDLESPLGVSGFSRAKDLIKEADNLYSDLLWEFEGSQLAVDVDRTAFNYMKDINGKETVALPKLQDRLYRRQMDLGDDFSYNIFSPAIRDASIINGLNNQLMRIEDACALSRGTLSVVTESEARTATELKILKQRSFSANQDIQKALQGTLENVIKIMDFYCDLYEIASGDDYEVAYKWDDSIIVDKDTERQQDLLEVKSGLMSKLEYRMKWYGETEDQAKKSLNIIDTEKTQELELTQSVTLNGTNTNTNGNNDVAKSDAQAEHDKKQRANESDETTTKNKEN